MRIDFKYPVESRIDELNTYLPISEEKVATWHMMLNQESLNVVALKDLLRTFEEVGLILDKEMRCFPCAAANGYLPLSKNRLDYWVSSLKGMDIYADDTQDVKVAHRFSTCQDLLNVFVDIGLILCEGLG